MSHLLARIMLALLMLPMAAILYLVTVVVAMDLPMFGYNDDSAFFGTTLLIAAFVAGYWILLWRKTVRWTRGRLVLTGAAAVGASVVGGAVGLISAESLEASFGIFVGGIVAILAWLMMTVAIWRETRAERAGRLRSVAGDHAVACLRCGYNMTGLRQTTCPECGVPHTIDELLAGQRGFEDDELK